MSRLFEAKRLRVATDGSLSRQRSKIIEAPPSRGLPTAFRCDPNAFQRLTYTLPLIPTLFGSYGVLEAPPNRGSGRGEDLPHALNRPSLRRRGSKKRAVRRPWVAYGHGRLAAVRVVLARCPGSGTRGPEYFCSTAAGRRCPQGRCLNIAIKGRALRLSRRGHAETATLAGPPILVSRCGNSASGVIGAHSMRSSPIKEIRVMPLPRNLSG